MDGQGEQWLIVRNDRGTELLELSGREIKLSVLDSKRSRASAVKGFLANVERAAGGLPLPSVPNRLRPVVGWLTSKLGPARPRIRANSS